MSEVRIIPASIEHLDSFRECLDTISKERIYLARLEAPTADEMKDRFQSGQRNGFMQDWAMVGDRVVGWAIIMPSSMFGLTHSAGLAMGVHRDFRRQGTGSRLMVSVIEQAWQSGLERIELLVWADNQPAIALYEKLGFEHEGVLRNYRYLDGEYTDGVMMALLRE